MCEPNHKKYWKKSSREWEKRMLLIIIIIIVVILQFGCSKFEVCFVFQQWTAQNPYKTFELSATFHSFLTWVTFCSAILIFRNIFQFVAVSCVEVFWGVSSFDWRVPDMHCSTKKIGWKISRRSEAIEKWIHHKAVWFLKIEFHFLF